MKLAIVCLIGLPGSGKTSFCFNLNNSTERQSSEDSSNLKFVHVCFDELQRLSSNGCDSNKDVELDQLTPYKLFRYSVLALVEALVNLIRHGTDLQPPELFNTPEMHHYLTSQTNHVSSADNVCILIDDNMYYRSMRYSYYQLARKYSTGYGQIYFNTALEACLTRNRLRHSDQRIDESIIVKMGERLEPPDPSGHSWENHSMEFNICNQQKIFSFMKGCLDSPVVDNQVSDSTREESVKITAEDILHQSDLILRQLVKQALTSSHSVERSDMKVRATKVNERRKSLLSYVKSRAPELSHMLTDARQHSSRDPQSALYQFLESMFSVSTDV